MGYGPAPVPSISDPIVLPKLLMICRALEVFAKSLGGCERVDSIKPQFAVLGGFRASLRDLDPCGPFSMLPAGASRGGWKKHAELAQGLMSCGRWPSREGFSVVAFAGAKAPH